MRRFSLLLRRRPVLIGSLVGTMGLMFGFWRQASPSGGPKHSKLTLTGPELRSLGRASLWRTSTPPSQGRRSISPTEVTKYEAAVGGPAFIENKGQWPGEVLYLCRLGGLDAWITKWGVAYNFFQLREKAPSIPEDHPLLPDKSEWNMYEVIGHGVYMRLQGASAAPEGEGREALAGYYNYFIRNDPARWATNVQRYREVWVKGVYEGIDIRYYTEGGRLRFDWVVKPGAEPSQIALVLEGDKTGPT